MCYVGKATKIFIFIVIVLAFMGLILGFTLIKHGLRKSHKCSESSSDSSCSPTIQQFPNPIPAPLISTTPNPDPNPSPYPPPNVNPTLSPPPNPNLYPPPSSGSIPVMPPPPPPPAPVVVPVPPPPADLPMPVISAPPPSLNPPSRFVGSTPGPIPA